MINSTFQIERLHFSTQKLPLLAPITSFTLGLLVAAHIPANPNILLTWTLCNLASLIYLHHYKHFRNLLWIGFFLIGLLRGSECWYFSKNDIALLQDRQSTTLVGRVVSLPEEKWNGKRQIVSLILSVEKIKDYRKYKVVQGLALATIMNPGKEIKPGDLLRIKGSLETPKRGSSPGQFNYQEYLARMGIRKTIFAVGYGAVHNLPVSMKKNWSIQIHSMRMNLTKKINKLLPNPENALACAILLGIRKQIPNDIRDAFAKTGTAHLLAISGLNITLLSGLFYLFLRHLGIFRQKGNAFLSLILTCSYIFIAGANPPVLRAGIMASVFLFGILLERDGHFLNSLLLAFCILVIVDPQSLLTPSFQLSFMAVFALSLFSLHMKSTESLTRSQNLRNRLISSVARDFYASFITFLALLPIIAYYFNIISHIVFLANLIAGPLMLLANILLLVFLPIAYVSESLGQLVMILPKICFQITVWTLKLIEHIPGGYFYVPTPLMWQIVAYYAGLILIALTRRSKIMNYLGISLILISFIPTILIFIHSPLQVTFFDMRKKNACYFELPTKTNGLISIESGNLGENARWILRPFLMSKGINTLDHLFVKNAHQKQLKWKNELQSNFRIGAIHSLSAKGSQNSFPVDISANLLPVRILGENCVGFYLVIKKHKILVLNNLNYHQVFHLTQQDLQTADILFISHFPIENKYLLQLFLNKISARYLVVNDRQNSPQFLNQLSEVDLPQIFMISKTGTLTFKEINGELKPFPFLK